VRAQTGVAIAQLSLDTDRAAEPGSKRQAEQSLCPSEVR
jgi:hypothetical protein